jgi:predicted dehydrogenase
MGLNLSEVKLMNEELRKYPDLRVMEAFMYKFHPQWEKVKSLIASDSIGTLVHVHIHFSYAQLDPNNIRNQKRMGGGSLLDVGCYGISAARWLFEEEPMKVSGLSEYDPKMKNITIEKGSITINGVSLTVIDSGISEFSVAIIPYTYEHTNFHEFKMGTLVNLEFDVVGKYIAKMQLLN